MIGATVEYFYSHFACLHVRPACALGEHTTQVHMDSLNKARWAHHASAPNIFF